MLTKLWIVLLLALVACPLTAPFQTYGTSSTLGSTLTGTDAEPNMGQLSSKPARLTFATVRSSVTTSFDRVTAFLPSPTFQRSHARPFAERSVLRV